jgi:hypothetical protein
MALTDDQRASVRRYLGYPDRTQGFYSLLEGAMDALSTAGEAQVVALLTKLATLETRIETGWSTQNIKRAEEVEFFGSEGLAALLAEGNRLVNQLREVRRRCAEALGVIEGRLAS